MTTKLAYNWQTAIDYDRLEFNPDVLEPLPEGMYQNPIIFNTISILAAHFNENRRNSDVFLDSNTFICYDPANLNIRVSPDCYIAFGVEARTIEQRKLYLPWEVGKPPDLALEVASESAARVDLTRKRDIYARIGVPEYWRFDRSGGQFYGQPLVGERLVNGMYHPIDLIVEPDGVIKGYSPVLGLSVGWKDGTLAFYNHETGAYLRNLPDAEAALRAEQETRQRAEARALQLEEELRRLQQAN